MWIYFLVLYMFFDFKFRVGREYFYVVVVDELLFVVFWLMCCFMKFVFEVFFISGILWE